MRVSAMGIGVLLVMLAGGTGPTLSLAQGQPPAPQLTPPPQTPRPGMQPEPYQPPAIDRRTIEPPPRRSPGSFCFSLCQAPYIRCMNDLGIPASAEAAALAAARCRRQYRRCVDDCMVRPGTIRPPDAPGVPGPRSPLPPSPPPPGIEPRELR